jgi:hypothetical protein
VHACRDHPAHGAVRVIVRDENDAQRALLFLDSDGNINSNSNKTAQAAAGARPAHADVNDGEWHMVTVTTFDNATRGYALYIDGSVAGSLRAEALERAGEGGDGGPTGGDPATM